MQVSWIDPDELRDLVAKLEGPLSSGPQAGCALQTLPEPRESFSFDFLSDLRAPAPPEQEPVAPWHDDASPEVSLIREKLRLIRDRAEQAGLLTAPPVGPEPAALVPAPAPAPPEPPPVVPAQPVAPETPSVAAVPMIPPTAAQAPQTPPPAPPVALQVMPLAVVPPAATPPPPAPVASPAPSVEAKVIPPPTVTPVAPATTDTVNFLPLEGTLAERLTNFASWAIRFTTAEELLLLDDHGDLLWGSPTRDDLIISTMPAVNAALRSSAIAKPASLLRTAAGARRDLSILPCPTRYGTVTLALVNAKSTPADTLREALVLAIER